MATAVGRSTRGSVAYPGHVSHAAGTKRGLHETSKPTIRLSGASAREGAETRRGFDRVLMDVLVRIAGRAG